MRKRLKNEFCNIEANIHSISHTVRFTIGMQKGAVTESVAHLQKFNRKIEGTTKISFYFFHVLFLRLRRVWDRLGRKTTVACVIEVNRGQKRSSNIAYNLITRSKDHRLTSPHASLLSQEKKKLPRASRQKISFMTINGSTWINFHTRDDKQHRVPSEREETQKEPLRELIKGEKWC